MPDLPPPIDAAASFSVAGGRVSTLRVENHENVESIRVLESPDHGNLTVNPDNTLALVMSHDPGFSGQIDFSYEVTYTDGTTEVHTNTVSVQPSTQQAGWGQGNFYMLEQDENGDVIVEEGSNHRAVHISGSEDALGLADIAALEGISVDDITQQWLAEHEEYGSSPEMALDSEAGMRLWYGITGRESEPSSNWLLFERGYEYENLGRVIDRGTMGEDPLHPIHITSYGEGAKPVLNTYVFMIQESNENIVFSNVAITEGFCALSGKNLLLDNVDISNNANGDFALGINISGLDNFTMNNSSITDVYRTEPDNPNAEYWSNVMTSGIHIGNNTGTLIQGTLFDHNGWAPDYRYDMSTEGGLPPTMFNHNIYISETVTDFTLRDNVIMRGASYGIKVIPGGYIEDNVLLDNNNAATLLGGEPTGENGIRDGNFTLVVDNLITSAGYKETNHGNLGAVSRGIDNAGMDTTFIDNIIAHLADPDNPLEQAAKDGAQRVLFHGQDTPYFDDTIVYNWAGSQYAEPDQNTGGLNPAVLDATTIQRFTQKLLGDPDAGIPDLADYLRAQAAGALDHYVDADLIIDFFQKGFGVDVEDRVLPETLRFVPNDLGDGIRWDNRLNWTTDDLPGTIEGDSVDLGGNWVNYGGTTRIDDLDFGDAGKLTVSHGYLEVEDEMAVGAGGGELLIDGAGQFWTDGYGDRGKLTIDVEGGRFANTGVFKGRVDMTVSDGQAILATDNASFNLSAGSRLEILGREAQVGFDGENSEFGMLRLDDDSTLAFTAEAGEGLGRIREFQSGSYADNRPGNNFDSGADLGDARLEIDITALGRLASDRVLMRVDELIGSFGEVEIIGLGSNRDASIEIDYDLDKVTLRLGADGAGSGLTRIVTLNEDMEMTTGRASDDLWEALTADQGVLADDPITSDEDEEGMAEVLA